MSFKGRLESVKRHFTTKISGAKDFEFIIGDQVIAEIHSPLEEDPTVLAPVTTLETDGGTCITIMDKNEVKMYISAQYLHDPKTRSATHCSIPPSYPAKAAMFAFSGQLPKNLKQPETEFDIIPN